MVPSVRTRRGEGPRKLRIWEAARIAGNPIPRPTAEHAAAKDFPRNRRWPWNSLMLLPGAVPVGLFD